jgi:diguanylate cyclase (GGDEF)-like protein
MRPGPCFLILFASALAVLPVQAQKPARFQNIGLREGLANASVSSMVQDAAGFIWIGTQGGLHRWDGQSFALYENEPFNRDSLPHNLIQTMFMDPDGYTIWIGTYGGLTRFDTRTETFRSWARNPEDPRSLAGNVVVSIAKDAEGRLWAGTLDGLSRLEGDSFVNYRVDPDKPGSLGNNVIRALHLDSRGGFWVGTSGAGLHRYLPENDSFDRITAGEPGTGGAGESTLGSNYVMSISQDPEGYLWLGQWFYGLSRLDTATGRLEHYPLADDRVYFVNAVEQGRVYAGTWGGGLFELEPETGATVRHVRGERMWTLPHDTVYSCLVDSFGEVWIGTNGGGFSQLLREGSGYTMFEHDPADPGTRAAGKTSAVLEDSQGRLWVGIYNGGLSRLDPGQTAFRHFINDKEDLRSLPNNIVTRVYEDSRGRIWITSNGGIALYDDATSTFTRFVRDISDPDSLLDDVIYDLLEEPGTGNFWVATYTKGLAYWDRSASRFTHYQNSGEDGASISDNLVYALAMDKEGRLWAATNAGLNRYEGDGRFKRYLSDPDDPTSLPSKIIRDLHVDAAGVLWIATNGGGVARYRPATDDFDHWTKRDGLPSNAVVSILGGPSGTLWAATVTGIAFYEPGTGRFRPFTSFGDLRYGEFNVGRYRNASGQLYFGALNTLYRIDPSIVDGGSLVPPVRLTGITVLNEPYKGGVATWFVKSMQVPWYRSSLSFNFSSLDYRDPQRSQYAYILEGFDADWIYSGSRSYASYTNLPGGRTYTFRVRASTEEGLWNEDGIALVIRVDRAPWFTWWAYLMYLLALGLLVWVVTVARSRFVLRSRVDELTKVKGELEEANVRLGVLADHDGLTGLLNRRSLDAELKRRFAAAISLQEPVSVLMIDIDRFKEYNDHYGHQVGDECLVRVGRAIADALDRLQDSVTRYGGEEFLVLLPGTTAAGARQVAKRMVQAVADLAIPHAASDVFPMVTICIGVASLIPSMDDTSEKLVKLADACLYKAKQTGRNRVVCEGSTP